MSNGRIHWRSRVTNVILIAELFNELNCAFHAQVELSVFTSHSPKAINNLCIYHRAWVDWRFWRVGLRVFCCCSFIKIIIGSWCVQWNTKVQLTWIPRRKTSTNSRKAALKRSSDFFSLYFLCVVSHPSSELESSDILIPLKSHRSTFRELSARIFLCFQPFLLLCLRSRNLWFLSRASPSLGEIE